MSSSLLNTQIDVGNINEMLLFGIIINNVTLVENTGCQYGRKKLKRNYMEVYIKLYLAARRVNCHLSLLNGLLINRKKFDINHEKEIVLYIYFIFICHFFKRK